MVVLQFHLYARTQNVKAISMPTQSQWHCMIKCTSCNTDFSNQITVSTCQVIQVVKQQVNFQAKCKQCGRKGTLKISSNSSYIATSNQNGIIKQSICQIDCRGLQIISVNMGNSFTVQSTSGTIFQNADFTDQLWAQYDQDLSQLCQVQQHKIQIKRK